MDILTTTCKDIIRYGQHATNKGFTSNGKYYRSIKIKYDGMLYNILMCNGEFIKLERI